METLLDSLIAAALWVGRNSLEASLLLAAFLLLTLGIGRQLAPSLRVALWAAVALRLMLPFAPPSALSVHNLLPSPGAAGSSGPAPLVEPSPAKGVPVVAVATASPACLSANPSKGSRSVWRSLLALFWAGGALCVLLAALGRQRGARLGVGRLPASCSESLGRIYAGCVRHSGVTRPPRLVVAPSGAGVAVFGCLRASHLIVPADLEERYSETEIRGILLHELAHVRRGDLLVNWIVLAVQGLHWFNPLVWIAGRRFLADREELCDRAALRGLEPSQRRDYGAALLKALQAGRAPQACPALLPFVSRKSELQHRLTMIASPRSRNLLLQTSVALLALGLALATFTSAKADEGRSDSSGRRESPRDEGPGTGDASREGGERPRGGAREGERGSRDGERDGEGSPRGGSRDGERTREGVRDGERGSREGEMRRDGERSPREGAREGERTREGAREGERESREGEMRRDGERSPREGAREGGSASSSVAPTEREVSQWTRIFGAYDQDGDRAVTFEEWVAMKNYELTREQRAREKGWFDEADGNQDGKLTLGEWIDWKGSQDRRG